MNLYEILGVTKGASQSELKSAYRRMAQKLHPDKGGTHEQFQRIKEAFEVLSDPYKRKQYDSTGTVGNDHTIRDRALQELNHLFVHVLQNANERYDNIVQIMKDQLHNRLVQIQAQNVQIGKAIVKLKEIERRLKCTGSENILVGMNRHVMQSEIAKGRELKQAQRTFKLMLEMLEEYAYEADRRPGSTNITRGMVGGIPPEFMFFRTR